ncbi:MAG: phosphoadenylyl-sulfate reductase [Sphingomonas fennica]
MAEALRKIDVLDLGPSAADAAALDRRFEGVSAPDLLATVLREGLAGRVAAVTSFGAESAVLLHMVAMADPATPVLFVDTLKHFPETLAYRDDLVARLGLTNVISLQPDAALLEKRDPTGLRWSYDPDECCAIRKTGPIDLALAGYDSWISGRKGFQAKTRAGLGRFEVADGKLKINPLSDWTKDDLNGWFAHHGLPHHPLEAEGYLSIGCAPCTSVVRPGEDPRAGRWRGFDKTECGIHKPGEEPAF